MTGSLTAEALTAPIQVLAWGADWCKYCQRNKPELERLQKSGKYVIIYVDFDSNRELAKIHKVTNLPTYFVIEDDNVVYRTNSITDLKAYKPPRK